ncbi:hypothetical protein DK926_12835 [Rhodococcus sp. Eu-32]|uniref:hypothetical protein n=1 Tax=Rhodococcus sp. Eu-32 TaxID=1017319 RepID=UPI000F78C3B4|nr:hypothetical protein [Rhodococcus sp. Eu-32]RRQ27376.1 hypothetical protein DK926_12835 [Rhodococcus sp. Eu-32]
MRQLLIDATEAPDPSIALRGRVSEYTQVVSALLENFNVSFDDAEKARSALFDKHWGGGAGMGVPAHVQSAVVDALAIQAPESEHPAFEDVATAVVAGLTAIKRDTAGRARLAFASTLGHAESVWVQETAYQLLQMGIPPSEIRRESTVGAQRMVDLSVGDVPIEFKSTFASFALNHTLAHTAQWFGSDIDKIRSAGHDGICVISVAHLIGVPHQKIRFSTRKSHHLTHDEVRFQGLKRYSEYLEEETGTSPVHVDLGVTAVPASTGTVHLDALVARVPHLI